MLMERRALVENAGTSGQPGHREELAGKAKPFEIDKKEIVRAYRTVLTKGGAAGVDGQTIKDFGQYLKGNLYKLWNRMSSGSYFPPPVQRVEIPKAQGGKRALGIPTISDRIAQTVVKQRIQAGLESIFDEDSYGYRPKRSAHDALERTRQRCWQRQWVIELDIKS
jgi:retron-type reverse transcriptase